MASLAEIKIVLVEPAGPLNVGSVARVMKNMGLQQLVLVNPQCNPLSDEARKMAVHGLEILEQCQQVASLPAALTGCQRAIATTARPRHLPIQLEPPPLVLPWLLEEEISAALIFGPEERGLSNEELNQSQRFTSIPAHPAYPSLNLAQAVAICAYELYQASLAAAATSPASPPATELASLDLLESYCQHLEATLLKIGYLYPHTAAARMEKFRRLYQKANLSREELALLRGILGQIDCCWQLSPPFQSHKNRLPEG